MMKLTLRKVLKSQVFEGHEGTAGRVKIESAWGSISTRAIPPTLPRRRRMSWSQGSEPVQRATVSFPARRTAR